MRQKGQGRQGRGGLAVQRLSATANVASACCTQRTVPGKLLHNAGRAAARLLSEAHTQAEERPPEEGHPLLELLHAVRALHIALQQTRGAGEAAGR